MFAGDPLSVGEVAARSGVAVSALHFYEAEGLIASWRTAGNQRRYTREVLRRIAFIRVAQSVGIPLAEVREALSALPDNRTPNEKDWGRLARGWRKNLDERIAKLQALRDDLGECIGCGCLSVSTCRLYNPHDRLAAKGAGPQRVGPRYRRE